MKKVIRVKHGKKVHNSSALDCIDNIFFLVYTAIYFFNRHFNLPKLYVQKSWEKCQQYKFQLHMKGLSSFSFDRLNFDHPKVNAVTTLVQKNIKEISTFTA